MLEFAAESDAVLATGGGVSGFPEMRQWEGLNSRGKGRDISRRDAIMSAHSIQYQNKMF